MVARERRWLRLVEIAQSTGWDVVRKRIVVDVRLFLSKLNTHHIIYISSHMFKAIVQFLSC